MAFKELPLNSRLLEQFDQEPISDAEAYNPNVQAMEFGEYELELIPIKFISPEQMVVVLRNLYGI